MYHKIIVPFSLTVISFAVHAIDFDIPPSPGQKRIQVTIPATPSSAPVLDQMKMPPNEGKTKAVSTPNAKYPRLDQMKMPPKEVPPANVVSPEPKYVVKEVAKTKVSNCKPMTVAMTFQNIPTQKGPYVNRWVSLGCEADEVNFVREGNDKYVMSWHLAYVPEDTTLKLSPRYFLKWSVAGTDEKGNNVDWKAQHTFSLESPKTLSLTNNMAVTLRKVP